jgi:hypothetical protein
MGVFRPLRDAWAGRTLPGLALALGLLLHGPAPAAAQGLPTSSLAVRQDGSWVTWWRSDRAPAHWPASRARLAESVVWEPVHPGVDQAVLELAGSGLAWRLRVILVRIDPRQLRLELAEAVRDEGLRGAWTVDSVPAAAVFGSNAGQFVGGTPWGWLVRSGRELQPPGTGALSMALVVDTAGGVRLVPVDGIAALRVGREVAQAFQSYPLLLTGDGAIPTQLAAAGRGVDVQHRDSRLAVGELRDGRLLLALTRFGALGDTFASLPFGPTTPEMAALMGALGCRQAVMLDGGLSGQLLIRGGQGPRVWSGWRRVPLGLIGYPIPAVHGS